MRVTVWLRNETRRTCGTDWCLRFGRVHGVSFFGKNKRRNESIPSSGYGLDKPRGFRVVLQYLANFADCTPDAVIRIQENVIAPNPGYDFVATDNLSAALQQQNQNFQWDTFQL